MKQNLGLNLVIGSLDSWEEFLIMCRGWTPRARCIGVSVRSTLLFRMPNPTEHKKEINGRSFVDNNNEFVHLIAESFVA